VKPQTISASPTRSRFATIENVPGFPGHGFEKTSRPSLSKTVPPTTISGCPSWFTSAIEGPRPHGRLSGEAAGARTT
jgi:hypothetical protein